MRKQLVNFSWTAVLLAFCASVALADDPVTLKLTSAGAGSVMGGVYTSPYGVSITDGQTKTSTLLICDDFWTDVSINQTWTANVTTLQELQDMVGSATNPQVPKFATGPKIGSTYSVTELDIANYATAGVLAAQLMSLSNLPVDATARGELSFAIWGVFDTNLLGNSNPASLSSANLNSARGYLSSAHTIVANASVGNVFGATVDLSELPFASLLIYTPTPLWASQEFLGVSMPEPSSIAILALDLLGLAMLVRFVRRREATQ